MLDLPAQDMCGFPRIAREKTTEKTLDSGKPE
jgi:hypothetical protein